jgi:hypothetical protein
MVLKRVGAPAAGAARSRSPPLPPWRNKTNVDPGTETECQLVWLCLTILIHSRAMPDHPDPYSRAMPDHPDPYSRAMPDHPDPYSRAMPDICHKYIL